MLAFLAFELDLIQSDYEVCMSGLCDFLNNLLPDNKQTISVINDK